ncbi:hydrolase [Ascochyta rabiei]|uniref:Hydrolase n=1 Tax=Didymella rabiei TaxID=5454 RepID=A0A163MIM6_DIDRA|nr:hydrolase [Ascochyta rabiei]
MMHLLAIIVAIQGVASASITENLGLLQQHPDTSSAYRPVKTQDRVHSPPDPEEIEVVELPLPPVAPNRECGSCSVDINPRRTGCIARDLTNQKFQSGDFTPDGKHVVVNAEFVGAPAAPEAASIYDGEQVMLIKADGSSFSNGDPWKCLSCGVPAGNAQSLDSKKDYPHVFRSGTKAIWGHNILDCDGEQLSSESCTPDRIHIYPIHWPGTNSTPRELRVHPDDSHIGWSSFTAGGQFAYFGRLAFNAAPTDNGPSAPRYDLVDVNLLVDPTRATPLSANGTQLTIDDDAITVGELRGFSGSGNEITYIGYPTESTNIDLYAVHVETGVVRRLTSHPEYADPMAFSADDEWFVTMDTRGSERQMWMAGLRGVPPLVDLVAVMAAASTRNNGVRRFFQPILIDRYGDRGEYFGQQVNAAGDKNNGAVNDPNWNGRADPAFSPDGTTIVYWQALVSAPACGGENALECPESTAQGGREYRVMLARLTSRKPAPPKKVYEVPDYLPWAAPFKPGFPPPSPLGVHPGNYTLTGKISGHANVRLFGGASTTRVAVNYTNYADNGEHVLNGYEDVEVTTTPPNLWENKLDWYSDIVQTKAGEVTGTKVTSPGGFHLSIDAMTNIFEANGTLTTTVDGKGYEQPANGT